MTQKPASNHGPTVSIVTLTLAFAALLAAAAPTAAQTLSIGADSDGTGDATGKEGQTVMLTVKMSAMSTSEVTVKWRYVSGGTAGSSDYSHDGGTSAQNLTFAAGQTSKTVSIDLVNDDKHEVEESFEVELHEASGATIDRSRATITIEVDADNPDLPVEISVTPRRLRLGGCGHHHPLRAGRHYGDRPGRLRGGGRHADPSEGEQGDAHDRHSDPG